MSFFSVSELPGTEMLPGVVRRAVYLEHVMMTFFDFAPGSVVPEHDHPHEQITYVVAGDGVCCPPGVPHSAVILDEHTVALDAWYPLREEYR
jgi:quercetin dioxygenase-like cupin family protein